MIKDRAMELVAALRSGKYQQTTGKLRGEGGFCCLGVACDISGVAKWESGDSDDDLRFYLNNDTDLPPLVREHFGFSSPGGHILGEPATLYPRDWDESVYGEAPLEEYNKYESLIDMNDEGRSFLEIADFIELNWSRL